MSCQNPLLPVSQHYSKFFINTSCDTDELVFLWNFNGQKFINHVSLITVVVLTGNLKDVMSKFPLFYDSCKVKAQFVIRDRK